MVTENNNLFENSVSIEILESRLELAAAASKIHVDVEIDT